MPKTGNAVIDADAGKKTVKDVNRGFKTADDGRLIIEEPTRRDRRGKDESESDDDFDMDSEAEDAINNGGKKRMLDADEVADSDDDSDADEGPSRKRALLASGAQSMASGRTGKSSQYVAGGKGIHRSTSGAASVRSGVSRMSTATGKSAATGKSVGGKSAFGSAYKSKKAGGDLKKGNLDPYAYIPLSRTSMNKR